MKLGFLSDKITDIEKAAQFVVPTLVGIRVAVAAGSPDTNVGVLRTFSRALER